MATTNKKYLDQDGLTELIKLIKSVYDNKTGEVYYDVETQYIYFFKNVSDRVKWCIDNDINSDLIIYKRKIIPEFKTILNNTSISIEGYTGNTIATLPSATQSSAGLLAANDKLKLDNIYNSLKDKQEKMNINIINSVDSGTEYKIKKNSILKIIDNITDELVIKFETPSMDDYDKFIQYGLYFSTDSLGNMSLNMPSNIKWANDNILYIKPSCVYEIIFTTCDSGGTYTATYASYSLNENEKNIDNKPYFTTEFTTGGDVCIARRSSTSSAIPSNEQPYYYSIYNSSSGWGEWQALSPWNYKSFTTGSKVRWKCNGYINIANVTNTVYGNRTDASIDQSYTPGNLYYSFIFRKEGNVTSKSDPQVKLSGNILSIMYGDDFLNKEDTELPAGAFQRLFRVDTGGTNNTFITDASDLILPSKILSVGSYYQMFFRCTALKGMPKILAETAADFCCKDMFTHCASLINTQDLIFNDFGTTIHACAGMFYGCTALQDIVIPPATKIACGTYYQMYHSCTGLTSISDIPVVEISKYNDLECSMSMRQMFYNCTNLTKLNGSLKVKIPGCHCYLDMFNGCTNLKIAPEILATQSAAGFCKYMFQDCTNLVVPPPYLPKTVTAGSAHAYFQMFCNCSSLESGPILPAEVPVLQMYYRMFYNCSSLKNIPYIGLHRVVSGVSSGKCCEDMFYGCNALKHVELSKNIKYDGINPSQQSPGWINKIFTGTESLESIRICYDLSGTNATDTYNALYAAFGFALNGSNNTRWYTRSNNSVGGTLYIPKSLSDKINQIGRWEEFCDHMVPDNWVVVAE